MLDSPNDAQEIYLARGEEVDAYRPICQGDVFQGVEIPGLDASHAVMVIAHPCTMRAGPRLRSKVTVIPVAEHQSVPLDRWATHHLRVFPLPGLDPGQPENHYAARFDEFGTVPSEALRLDRRAAILSQRGLLLLQQRFFHSLSRAEIPLGMLLDASAAVLEELELQENWNLAFVAPSVEEGNNPLELLEEEAHTFDALLNTVEQDATLRERLQVPEARAEVRRAVNQAIRERRAEISR